METTVSYLNEKNTDEKDILRLLTYNVEWGFLNLPSDITSDSCGHQIPQTREAQEQHLKLISKNIGLLNPDICFLQEMGRSSASFSHHR